ncbi:hypothetical protein PIB30_017158 [Stylosanthes scabra]|uniref:Uncharacterized protein n=1 Tax=Stylosanthes scabra TaxID=79078 RepID=A0ABU6W8F1_9FABA|nr:hypothetical protein [Stylosanthes scabra]
MSSSSRATKRRRGKEVINADDNGDTYNVHRFFSKFHNEFFYRNNLGSKAIIPSTKFDLGREEYRRVRRQIDLRGWVRLGKPKTKISAALVREFYANARTDPDAQDDRSFQTFVQGQVQLQKELTNYNKNFSDHMSKMYKSFKDQGVRINDNYNLLERNTVYGEANQMYTNWGLQQFIPALEPIPPPKGSGTMLEHIASSFPNNYLLALYHSQQIKGDAVYEIDPAKDVEAYKYTTVDEYLNQFV